MSLAVWLAMMFKKKKTDVNRKVKFDLNGFVKDLAVMKAFSQMRGLCDIFCSCNYVFLASLGGKVVHLIHRY